MPANIECPCGHTVRVPDELMNTRVKCPVCGEMLSASTARPDEALWEEPEQAAEEPSKTVEDPSATSPQPTTETPPATDRQKTSAASGQPRTVSTDHAKSGFVFAGLPLPSFFSKASVALLPGRVQVKSSGVFRTRHVDLRLSRITSIETCRSPNWYFLFLGILLLPANGVGLLLIVPFLIVRHSYLILRCGNTTVALRFKGDNTDASAISEAILQSAQTAANFRE